MKRVHGESERKTLRFSWPLFLVVSIVLVVLVVSLSMWRSSAEAQKVVTYSVDNPSEQKPGPFYVWQGAPEDPKKILIPSIGVDAYVQKVGVDQNNMVAVPTNIHIAGWFVKMARPGQNGLSIIDGHVDGRNGPGVFAELSKLKKDDEYTIVFGSGQRRKFRIVEMVEVSAQEAATKLFSQNPNITSQLNLITCSGSFDEKNRAYEKRTIAVSSLVE